MAPTVNFEMKFKAAKQGFFDDNLIKAKMDEVTHKRLSEFGAFVMTRARRSIKPSKNTSLPGKPPRSHVGLLIEGQTAIVFSYEPNRHSVVIGPTLTNKSSGAPKRLEYGGVIDVEGKTIYRKQVAGREAKTGRFVSKGVVKEVLHGTRTIAPRPYMHPAFEAELPKHLEKWKNSLK